MVTAPEQMQVMPSQEWVSQRLSQGLGVTWRWARRQILKAFVETRCCKSGQLHPFWALPWLTSQAVVSWGIYRVLP